MNEETNDLRNLKYIKNELKDDKQYMLEAIKKNGMALKYASKRLQNDKELVLEAIKKDKNAFEYASDELKKEPDIINQMPAQIIPEFADINFEEPSQIIPNDTAEAVSIPKEETKIETPIIEPIVPIEPIPEVEPIVIETEPKEETPVQNNIENSGNFRKDYPSFQELSDQFTKELRELNDYQNRKADEIKQNWEKDISNYNEENPVEKVDSSDGLDKMSNELLQLNNYINNQAKEKDKMSLELEELSRYMNESKTSDKDNDKMSLELEELSKYLNNNETNDKEKVININSNAFVSRDKEEVVEKLNNLSDILEYNKENLFNKEMIEQQNILEQIDLKIELTSEKLKSDENYYDYSDEDEQRLNVLEEKELNCLDEIEFIIFLEYEKNANAIKADNNRDEIITLEKEYNKLKDFNSKIAVFDKLGLYDKRNVIDILPIDQSDKDIFNSNIDTISFGVDEIKKYISLVDKRKNDISKRQIELKKENEKNKTEVNNDSKIEELKETLSLVKEEKENLINSKINDDLIEEKKDKDRLLLETYKSEKEFFERIVKMDNYSPIDSLNTIKSNYNSGVIDENGLVDALSTLKKQIEYVTYNKDEDKINNQIKELNDELREVSYKLKYETNYKEEYSAEEKNENLDNINSQINKNKNILDYLNTEMLKEKNEEKIVYFKDEISKIEKRIEEYKKYNNAISNKTTKTKSGENKNADLRKKEELKSSIDALQALNDTKSNVAIIDEINSIMSDINHLEINNSVDLMNDAIPEENINENTPEENVLNQFGMEMPDEEESLKYPPAVIPATYKSIPEKIANKFQSIINKLKNLSKKQIVGLIVAGVVAISGLGITADKLFDKTDSSEPDPSIDKIGQGENDDQNDNEESKEDDQSITIPTAEGPVTYSYADNSSSSKDKKIETQKETNKEESKEEVVINPLVTSDYLPSTDLYANAEYSIDSLGNIYKNDANGLVPEGSTPVGKIDTNKVVITFDNNGQWRLEEKSADLTIDFDKIGEYIVITKTETPATPETTPETTTGPSEEVSEELGDEVVETKSEVAPVVEEEQQQTITEPSIQAQSTPAVEQSVEPVIETPVVDINSSVIDDFTNAYNNNEVKSR